MILNCYDDIEKTCVIKVVAVSYAGNPLNNTCMYISAKVKQLVENLKNVTGCLVFLEQGVDIPENTAERNCFVYTDNPQRDYAKYVKEIETEKENIQKKQRYTFTEGGYFLGQNAEIGDNAYIEPNCLIGHDVTIGKNARIFSGAKIKNATIGDNFIAGENCVIGTYGFTMTDDSEHNKIRIPTIGKVVIGNNVEIGTLTNVSVGSAGDTIIKDNVKIDALVHIGHDARMEKNVEIPAGAIIGGFDILHEGAYVGINATLRNRIEIGAGALIGMGAVVTKNVAEEEVVIGNPARPLRKEK